MYFKDVDIIRVYDVTGDEFYKITDHYNGQELSQSRHRITAIEKAARKNWQIIEFKDEKYND